MSDLRFVRELGAEFERLERTNAAGSRRRRFPSWTGNLPARLAAAASVAVPIAIAVLAFALLGHSRDLRRHAATTTAPQTGLALSGGNCRTPTQAASPVAGSQTRPGSDGMILAASGRVSGIAWRLRVKPDTELPGSLEHGRLHVGAHQYGLCSQRSVPVPFGLINAGAHGIVYGYVSGAGSYSITVSAGGAPLTTTVTDTFFFIGALPRPACSYRALTVTAMSSGVAGMPPAISRSLDENAPHFTTTMRFGACRPHALVTPVSENGQRRGRSPNAPLAHVIAQLNLIAPPGSHSHATGTVSELAHNGIRGIELLAVGLTPGRYGIWLLGPRGRTTAVAAATIKRHELRGSFDLPADASSARQIVVTAQPAGQTNNPGAVVLRATLP